jgi:hypothetical protein
MMVDDASLAGQNLLDVGGPHHPAQQRHTLRGQAPNQAGVLFLKMKLPAGDHN